MDSNILTIKDFRANNKGNVNLKLFISVLFLTIISSYTCLADPLVKDGEKIVFMGDSITAQGTKLPSGYVRLVISALNTNGIKIVPYFAGIGGNKSNDMLARLENDVLSRNPDSMTLSCGVNDVWHGKKGVPLDQYKKNITAITERAQAANIRVILLTATLIGEDPNNPNNLKLKEYNDFLRIFAKQKNCLIADLNNDMQEALKEASSKMTKQKNGNYLTADGVHMNVYGDQVMAIGLLKAFGLDDFQNNYPFSALSFSKKPLLILSAYHH